MSQHRHRVADEARDDGVEATLGCLDQTGDSGGQHHGHQGVGSESTAHGRVEGGDLRIQTDVGELDTEVRQRHPIRFERADAPNQPRQILDSRRATAEAA